MTSTLPTSTSPKQGWSQLPSTTTKDKDPIPTPPDSDSLPTSPFDLSHLTTRILLNHSYLTLIKLRKACKLWKDLIDTSEAFDRVMWRDVKKASEAGEMKEILCSSPPQDWKQQIRFHPLFTTREGISLLQKNILKDQRDLDYAIPFASVDLVQLIVMLENSKGRQLLLMGMRAAEWDGMHNLMVEHIRAGKDDPDILSEQSKAWATSPHAHVKIVKNKGMLMLILKSNA